MGKINLDGSETTKVFMQDGKVVEKYSVDGKVATLSYENVAHTNGQKNDVNGRQLTFEGDVVGSLMAMQQGPTIVGNPSYPDSDFLFGTSNHMKQILSSQSTTTGWWFPGQAFPFLLPEWFDKNPTGYAQVEVLVYRWFGGTLAYPNQSGAKTHVRIKRVAGKWVWKVEENFAPEGPLAARDMIINDRRPVDVDGPWQDMQNIPSTDHVGTAGLVIDWRTSVATRTMKTYLYTHDDKVVLGTWAMSTWPGDERYMNTINSISLFRGNN